MDKKIFNKISLALLTIIFGTSGFFMGLRGRHIEIAIVDDNEKISSSDSQTVVDKTDTRSLASVSTILDVPKISKTQPSSVTAKATATAPKSVTVSQTATQPVAVASAVVSEPTPTPQTKVS